MSKNESDAPKQGTVHVSKICPVCHWGLLKQRPDYLDYKCPICGFAELDLTRVKVIVDIPKA